MDNQALIQKADMVIGDLASGGLLTTEQSNSFIRNLILAPTILNQARVVAMNSPKREINKIGFGSRILKKAVAATGLSSGDRSKPDLGKVTLDTNEVIAEVRLPYDVIEDNIERGNLNLAGENSVAQPVKGGFKDTIMALIAERAALDMEELALLGDTESGDDFLALNNGWLKQITSNTVNQATATIDRAMFKKGVKAMPPAYLRNRSQFKHFVSHNQETEYRDVYAARETSRGDQLAEGLTPVAAFGSSIVPVGLMPEASGIYTNPKNFIMGIQRKISVEVAKDISARVFIIVLTARIDFKIEEELACVEYTNIGS
jgi:hypothetical protein